MKSITSVLIIFAFSLTAFSASADWTLDTGPINQRKSQDIVITLDESLSTVDEAGNTEPSLENIEEICLAITMARMLQDDHNVTLFVRNDGVYLADKVVVEGVSELQGPGTMCVTPSGEFETLQTHLEAFLDGNNDNLVNCPICWCARRMMTPTVCWGDYYDGFDKYYGVLNSNAVREVISGAEKVIDF